MLSRVNEAEADVLVAVQSVADKVPGSTRVARELSHFGEHAVGWLGLAAVGAFVNRQRRREWLELGGAAFLAHAASVVLKRVVRRRRPHDPRIAIGVGTPSQLSFPSSHATSTAAALTSLARLTGSRVPLVGIPVMMVSRMILGVHYPSDTALGAGLGVATSCLVHGWSQRRKA